MWLAGCGKKEKEKGKEKESKTLKNIITWRNTDFCPLEWGTETLPNQTVVAVLMVTMISFILKTLFFFTRDTALECLDTTYKLPFCEKNEN